MVDLRLNRFNGSSVWNHLFVFLIRMVGTVESESRPPYGDFSILLAALIASESANNAHIVCNEMSFWIDDMFTFYFEKLRVIVQMLYYSQFLVKTRK